LFYVSGMNYFATYVMQGVRPPPGRAKAILPPQKFSPKKFSVFLAPTKFSL